MLKVKKVQARATDIQLSCTMTRYVQDAKFGPWWWSDGNLPTLDLNGPSLNSIDAIRSRNETKGEGISIKM